MWDLETWKNIGTVALVILGFTWPLILIVGHAIYTGEPLCDCMCHREGRPNMTRDGEHCPCGDRW